MDDLASVQLPKLVTQAMQATPAKVTKGFGQVWTATRASLSMDSSASVLVGALESTAETGTAGTSTSSRDVYFVVVEQLASKPSRHSVVKAKLDGSSSPVVVSTLTHEAGVHGNITSLHVFTSGTATYVATTGSVSACQGNIVTLWKWNTTPKTLTSVVTRVVAGATDVTSFHTPSGANTYLVVSSTRSNTCEASNSESLTILSVSSTNLTPTASTISAPVGARVVVAPPTSGGQQFIAVVSGKSLTVLEVTDAASVLDQRALTTLVNAGEQGATNAPMHIDFVYADDQLYLWTSPAPSSSNDVASQAYHFDRSSNRINTVGSAVTTLTSASRVLALPASPTAQFLLVAASSASPLYLWQGVEAFVLRSAFPAPLSDVTALTSSLGLLAVITATPTTFSLYIAV